jgi:AAA domain
MIEPEFPEDDEMRPVGAKGPVVRLVETVPLSPAENAALDIKAIQQGRAKASKGYPFKTFDEMAVESVKKRWLIKNVFARGETSAWVAPPGRLKSALMASAAIHVSAGLDWFGYRSKETAGVVYFAIERADLVRRRLQAHGIRQSLRGLPIVVVNATIDLTHPDAFKKVIDTIREATACLGIDIGLVIASAGGEENSAKDQGMVFAHVQRVKNVTDVHVALVGHTGKDEARGMRGSNAAPGDFDVQVMISGDDTRTATVTKANDAPEGPLFSFKSEVHSFGTDEDGDPITVNVVSSEAVSVQSAPNRTELKLKPNQQTVFAILHSGGKAGLTLEDWNNQAKDAGIGTKRKADLTDIRNALLSKRLVRTYGDRWYVVHE